VGSGPGGEDFPHEEVVEEEVLMLFAGIIHLPATTKAACTRMAMFLSCRPRTAGWKCNCSGLSCDNVVTTLACSCCAQAVFDVVCGDVLEGGHRFEEERLEDQLVLIL
jgi:hypothetical protein